MRDSMMRHEVLAAGAATGVAGGAAMIALAAIAAAAQGIEPAQPLAALGETFVGPEALDGVPARAAFGLLVHLATAAVVGVVFAAVAPRDLGTTCAIGLGIGFALLAMGLLMTVVVPWANPGLRAGLQHVGGTWVAAHAVFGAALGLAPALRRWISLGSAGARAAATGAAGPAPSPSRTS